jgi:hypothetical protein
MRHRFFFRFAQAVADSSFLMTREQYLRRAASLRPFGADASCRGGTNSAGRVMSVISENVVALIAFILMARMILLFADTSSRAGGHRFKRREATTHRGLLRLQ